MTQVCQARQALELCDANWTPLRHWTETELAEMIQRFSMRYEGWARDWMAREDFWALSRVSVGVASMLSARLDRAHALLPLHSTNPETDAGTPRAWIGLPLAFNAPRGESVAQLGVRIIFGEPARGDRESLATDMALTALASLAAIVQAAIGLPEAAVVTDGSEPVSALPDNVFHGWAGCVRVSLPCSGGASIYLNGAAARNLLGAGYSDGAPEPTGGLTPVQEAASAATVGLGVRLNPVELTFGQLKSLQIGDVVVLPHPVAEPLSVVAQSDTLLCKAYLGRSGERRALQVVRRTASVGKPVD